MKKNILIFGHGYANGFIEATNQYVKLFDPTQYCITIVYLSGNPDSTIIQKHLTDNIIFLNVPPPKKRGLKINIIKKMITLQREKQFQIVICHRYKPTYVMLWVARFCKIPVLISVMHEMNTLSHFSRKYLVSMLASSNTVFAGVSNAVRDDIKKNLTGISPDRIITLYNMIDIEQTESQLLARTSARKLLKLNDKDFIFGILGRLVKAKDHATLIDAFALIKPRCPNAKLIIMGEGELEAELKTQIQRLQLENDILMTGFLPNAPNLLKALDVFVLSSIKEAFGRVLLEAMVAKTPLIATLTNGIPEVVGDAGFLTKKENSAQLAEKMQTLYNMSPSELLQWGEKSYQRAVEIFSIKRFREIFWQLPLLKQTIL